MEDKLIKRIFPTVIAFILCELVLVSLIVLFATAAAVNRGSEPAMLGIDILMFGCLILPFIILLGKALKKPQRYIVSGIILMTAVIVVCAIFLPKPILEQKSQAKLSRHQEIVKHSQVEILEEKGIFQDGLLVGINIRLLLSLPASEDLKPVMVVPYYVNSTGDYVVIMRTASCGSVNPATSCHKLSNKDHQSSVSWPTKGRSNKKRELYYNLVPASGDGAKWMKNIHPEKYRVPEKLFADTIKRLPLRLGLLSPRDNEVIHLDFSTLNEYNLPEIYTNAGSQDVMKYLLSPVSDNNNKLGTK